MGGLKMQETRVRQETAGSTYGPPASQVSCALPLELVFHAETFAFDDDGLRVMQQPVQDGGRQGTVIVKDRGPFLEGTIRGQHDRPLFIAEGDDLEEQIGPCLVNRHVAQLVEDEQRGLSVFLDRKSVV